MLQRYGAGGFHRTPEPPTRAKLKRLYTTPTEWHTQGFQAGYDRTLNIVLPRGAYRFTLENTSLVKGASFRYSLQWIPCDCNGTVLTVAYRHQRGHLCSKMQRVVGRASYAEHAFSMLAQEPNFVMLQLVLQNNARYANAYCQCALFGLLKTPHTRIQVLPTPSWLPLVRKKLRAMPDFQHTTGFCDTYLDARARDLGDAERYYHGFFKPPPQKTLDALKNMVQEHTLDCSIEMNSLMQSQHSVLEQSIAAWRGAVVCQDAVPIKLLLTDLSLRHNWKAFSFVITFVGRLQPQTYHFGAVHTALQIGPWIIDLMGNGFVIPRFCPDPSALLSFDLKRVPRSDLATLLKKVSTVASEWNHTQEYDHKEGNCQRFTAALMQALDVTVPEEDNPHLKRYLADLRRYGEKVFFSFRKDDNDTTTTQRITFHTHAELDDYIRDAQVHKDKHLYALLKGFDRAFWLRHNRHPKDPKYKDHACPLGDPTLTESGFVR